jgi:hypothetical protein
MDRDLPGPSFRLHKGQLWYLLDLAVAAALFVFVGRLYMEKKGSAVIAAREQALAAARSEGVISVAQADSVMQVQLAALAAMKADSIQLVKEYEQKRATLEAGFQVRQTLTQNLAQVSDVIFGMRDRSVQAVSKAHEIEQDVNGRKDEETALVSKSQETGVQLKSTEDQRAEAAGKLTSAYALRTYEPVSLFPDNSGVMFRQEVSSGQEVTNVELQHMVVRDPKMDVGFALGVGLGSGDRGGSKQVGLILSRPLIHRRLGLDLSAGYSLLTSDAGKNNSTPYAMAGIRYSPFYKERFHFGLGARADKDQILPYVGITLGRR